MSREKSKKDGHLLTRSISITTPKNSYYAACLDEAKKGFEEETDKSTKAERFEFFVKS